MCLGGKIGYSKFLLKCSLSCYIDDCVLLAPSDPLVLSYPPVSHLSAGMEPQHVMAGAARPDYVLQLFASHQTDVDADISCRRSLPCSMPRARTPAAGVSV